LYLWAFVVVGAKMQILFTKEVKNFNISLYVNFFQKSPNLWAFLFLKVDEKAKKWYHTVPFY